MHVVVAIEQLEGALRAVRRALAVAGIGRHARGTQQTLRTLAPRRALIFFRPRREALDHRLLITLPLRETDRRSVRSFARRIDRQRAFERRLRTCRIVEPLAQLGER